MNIIRLVPVFLSFLLIAAHFQRAGMTAIAIGCLAAPGMLIFTRGWSVRIVQGLLVLASLEWLRALFYLVSLRQEHGMPWTRLAIILGLVSLLTAASALVFFHRDIKRKYNVK